MPGVTPTVSALSASALRVKRLNTQIKSKRLAEQIRAHDLAVYCLQEIDVTYKYITRLKIKECER